VLTFFAGQPACVVAMEACSSAHYWARAIGELGHVVRLIAPAYVKPFVKRQKNDTTDAEAICEAAQRPTMRFVSVKSETAQANAVVFRTRDLLVRQRTQAINALRGHLGEYGVVVAKGPSHVAKLIAHGEDPAAGLSGAARTVLRVLIASLQFLSERCRPALTDAINATKALNVMSYRSASPVVPSVSQVPRRLRHLIVSV
jgi:transposase